MHAGLIYKALPPPAAQTYYSPEHHACKHVSENCDAIDDDVAGGLPTFEETLDVYR